MHTLPSMEVEVDPDSAALIAKLALEDIEALYDRRWGKSRVGATRSSDEEYAYRLQAEQFREWTMTTEDSKLANSLQEASQTDAAYLEALMIAEQAAADDRRAALALSRGQPLPPLTTNQTRMEDRTFNMHPEPTGKSTSNQKSKAMDMMMQDDSIYGDESDDDDDDDDSSMIVVSGNQSEIARNAMIQKSFGTSMAGPSVNRNVHKNCIICDDKVKPNSDLLTPCGHYYCRSCLGDLIDNFTRDESLYPLRCCQTAIPVNNVLRFISTTLRIAFEAKQAEYTVPTKDRIYCSNPTCSLFLGTSVGKEPSAGVLCTAQNCRTSTCPRCKQASHPNELNCGDNKASREVRELAIEQGWQTCPGCHAIVELDVGCFHMSCLCRTEFCYLCAVPWKQCECQQWEERRLLATAAQRLENQIGARAAQMRNNAPDIFQHRVQQVADALRVNHGCSRHIWRYRNGGGTCEQCSSYLPKFLFICTQCSFLACFRCSRNRL